MRQMSNLGRGIVTYILVCASLKDYRKKEMMVKVERRRHCTCASLCPIEVLNTERDWSKFGEGVATNVPNYAPLMIKDRMRQ